MISDPLPLPLPLQAAAARLVRRGVLLPMDPVTEEFLIHMASCRYLRQDLICSTCFQLTERAERMATGAGRWPGWGGAER